MKAKFIVFEGIDGSGKTGALRAASAFLTKEGIPHICIRQPGGTPAGEALRPILKGMDIETYTEMLLFCASFHESLQKIITPALEKGIWILTDRWTNSTVAYQCGGRGLGTEVAAELDRATKRKPDLTLIFDVTPEEGVKRTGRRGEQDRFDAESLAFHNRVRDNYLVQAQGQPNTLIIDTNNSSIEEVEGSVLKHISKIIGTKRERIAEELCIQGHEGQKRRFTQEEYANHPIRVGNLAKEAYLAAGREQEAIIACCGGRTHDLLEDSLNKKVTLTNGTGVEKPVTISYTTISNLLGAEVANIVTLLTNQFTKENFPELNRKQRHQKEAQRLSTTQEMVQSIKVCDIIDNFTDFEHALTNDPNWAKNYLAEKWYLLQNLTAALPSLREEASKLLLKCNRMIPTHTEKTSSHRGVKPLMEAMEASAKAGGSFHIGPTATPEQRARPKEHGPDCICVKCNPMP